MGRAALIGENSIGYVNALIDIWNNGDCAVLLDWQTPPQALEEMIKEAGVQKCFIEKELYRKMEGTIPQALPVIPYDKINTTAKLLPKKIHRKYQSNYSKTEAVVIYSSGTTGTAKGIILSHFAISTNADAIISYMKPTRDDCLYIAKTLSHSSTLIGELLVALKTKMSVVIAPCIVPPRYALDNIKNYAVTIVCLNPTLLSMYADTYERGQYNLSTLRTIYVSGSILNDQIYAKAHSIFSNVHIYNVYGLSEAGPRVTAQREDCCKSNSVGRTIKNVEIKIINEHGEAVPHCQYGIIHVQTPSIFEGYIIGRVKNQPLYDGWYNTGDIGYIDENGELHIVSRLDDVIILDSHKVYPGEVEKAIVENSMVKECVVTKVEINGKDVIGCLYVSANDVGLDINKNLKQHLLNYEIPRFYIRCNELPKTKNGKVSIREAQAYLQRHIGLAGMEERNGRTIVKEILSNDFE